jgi:hypothetical protein
MAEQTDRSNEAIRIDQVREIYARVLSHWAVDWLALRAQGRLVPRVNDPVGRRQAGRGRGHRRRVIRACRLLNMNGSGIDRCATGDSTGEFHGPVTNCD